MDKDHIGIRYDLYLLLELERGEDMGKTHTFVMVVLMFVAGAGLATLGFISGNEPCSTAGVGLVTLIGGYVLRDKQDSGDIHINQREASKLAEEQGVFSKTLHGSSVGGTDV